jgi:hypothetical protein
MKIFLFVGYVLGLGCWAYVGSVNLTDAILSVSALAFIAPI